MRRFRRVPLREQKMGQIDKTPIKRRDNPATLDEQILNAINRAGGAATAGDVTRAGDCPLTQPAIYYRLHRLARLGVVRVDRQFGITVFRLPRPPRAARTGTPRQVTAGGDRHD
jgi:hypothetical protein